MTKTYQISMTGEAYYGKTQSKKKRGTPLYKPITN